MTSAMLNTSERVSVTAPGALRERYQAITRNSITGTEEWSRLGPDQREAIDVVSRVLPFRTNAYVLRSLIDWSRLPEDPMYHLTFPQRSMLDGEDYTAMRDLVARGAPREEISRLANAVRLRLNPQPDGQLTHNVPELDGERVRGIQHKYRETVLFFPSQGQTCHAYCTYCFRWAQFVGMPELRFAAADPSGLVSYLRAHPEVHDVLV